MAEIFETSIWRMAKRFRKSTPYSSEVWFLCVVMRQSAISSGESRL